MLSRRKRAVGLALALVAVVATAVYLAWPRDELPPYLAVGNGRIEATEYDVAAEVSGRLAELAPQEGDTVTEGNVVGRIAAEDLVARYQAALAQARAAADALHEAEANLRTEHSQLELARITARRSRNLERGGAIARERLDRDLAALREAEAALAGARAKVEQSRSAEAAARATAASLRETLANAELRAPVTGPVLYRLVEPGAVLAPGTKVLTVIDPADVYMTIFLPTGEAGRAQVGAEARIVLDALPERVIPARVSFVAERNQFTPREVETRDERQKLMFRVKVRVSADWLAAHRGLAKPGMPGMAYVLLDATRAWPADLEVAPPREKDHAPRVAR